MNENNLAISLIPDRQIVFRKMMKRVALVEDRTGYPRYVLYNLPFISLTFSIVLFHMIRLCWRRESFS